MQITNSREVRLTVPSLHIQANPGETVTVPDGSPVPDGFTTPAAPKAPTKAELLELAATLGLTIPPKATNAAIAAAIAEAELDPAADTGADATDPAPTDEPDDQPAATQE